MLGVLLIVVGSVNLYYAWRFFKNQRFAENYIKKSPKAYLLRKMYGEKKALQITRKILAPLGLVGGIIFLLIGILYLLG